MAPPAEVYEHVEGHQKEPATSNDLALEALGCETGLVHNISTELYHVLIMLTRLTSTTIGAQGVRAGGAGSVSPSPPTV